MGSAAMYNRLAKFGLRSVAEAYMDELRKRKKSEGLQPSPGP